MVSSFSGFGRLALAVAAASASLLPACLNDQRELRVREAVSALVRGEDPATAAMAARFGIDALSEIEAQMHEATPAARHRLLSLLRQIGHQEGRPLAQHLAHWAEDPGVRQAAKLTAAVLGATESE